MAITEVKEIADDRGGGDEPGERTYIRVFRVRTDNRYNDWFDIIQSGLVPTVGATHPKDLSATCRSSTPRQANPPYVWVVTCVYSNKTSTEIQENPLNDRTKITWDTESYAKTYTKDRAGNAITNSAGDPFVEGGVTDEDERQVAIIQKNIASPPSWLYTYRRSVNDSAIVIDGLPVAAETARLRRISLSDVQERNNVTYRTLVLVVAVDENGWDVDVLDRGYHKKDGLTGKLSRILLGKDMAVPTSPVLLDGAGGPLADPVKSDAIFLSYELLARKDYSVLPGITT